MLLILLSSTSSSSSPGRLIFDVVLECGWMDARRGSGGSVGQDDIEGGKVDLWEVLRVLEKAKRSVALSLC